MQTLAGLPQKTRRAVSRHKPCIRSQTSMKETSMLQRRRKSKSYLQKDDSIKIIKFERDYTTRICFTINPERGPFIRRNLDAGIRHHNDHMIRIYRMWDHHHHHQHYRVLEGKCLLYDHLGHK